MKVNVASSAGFCFGVKRALEIALKTVSEYENVFMLGDIVHNEDVIDQIKKTGITKIDDLKTGSSSSNNILLIRAHGSDKKTVFTALDKGYKVVDATCPMVKEIHKIAQEKETLGYRIIIIGDKNHDEVRGIIGQINTTPIIISNMEEILLRKLESITKAAVVVQSTQNFEKVLSIVEKLRSLIKGELDFNNTICSPTRIKQEEAKQIPVENDMVIVIGSQKSANTKRLYEISKTLNPNTHWINKKNEINPDWFKNSQTIGVLAGASTPNTTIHDIVNYLENL